MLTFDTIGDARAGIMDFYAEHFAALDQRFKSRFKDLVASPSPVDQIVGLGEFIYANRADMSDDAQSLAASLIAFATTNAWHGLLDDGRGNAIVANLRKDTGEIKTAPAAPDPRSGYAIPAAEVAASTSDAAE